ncbi:MAG: hypothetical protein HYZ45_10260, partial [Burkholderiales bacterium]|nr:hypothetical protein [Burkholderiales bacterium]
MTTTPIDSSTALIQQIEQLADKGLFLQAQALMPQLAQVPSIEARLVEERLLHHLGAMRRSQALILRLWRQQPQHAAVRNSYVQYLLRRQGPFAAWSLLQKFPFAFDAPPEVLGEWYGNWAETYGMLRDFASAEKYYQQARQYAPNSVWLTTQWAYVCEKRDQYAQGVELMREVLVQRPHYRPAIQFLAHLLTLVGADDEALDLLQQRFDQSESAALGGQLFELQFERGLYREASATLDVCERYAPLQEKNSQIWLASRRTDLALRLGNLAAAKDFARQVGSPFFDRIAERLQQDGALGKRVLLPVGFVRQNYQTCVPATLAALSLYWQRAADHLEIADEISYDGTSNYN